MDEIIIGDTVQLKGGEPVMTVCGVHPIYGQFECHWLNKGKLESGCFPVEALRKVEDENTKNED